MITDQGDVRHELLVDLPPQAAWDRFTGRMTEWWPSAHHIGSAPIQEIVVEPRVGGRWFTRHTDGSETSTGVVRRWEPPTRLELTWQITQDWAYDPDFVTTVSVRFTDAGDGRTLVELLHAGFDAYGTGADAMRTTFDSPDAWPATLAAFAGTTAGATTAPDERPEGGDGGDGGGVKYVLIGEPSGASMDEIMAVFPRHKVLVDQFVERGEVIGIGPFGDAGNMAIFRSREAAEAFATLDPFILEGLVSSHTIRPWLDRMLE